MPACMAERNSYDGEAFISKKDIHMVKWHSYECLFIWMPIHMNASLPCECLSVVWIPLHHMNTFLYYTISCWLSIWMPLYYTNNSLSYECLSITWIPFLPDECLSIKRVPLYYTNNSLSYEHLSIQWTPLYTISLLIEYMYIWREVGGWGRVPFSRI